MAKTTLRSNPANQTMHALVLFGLVLLMQRVSAAEFKVGESNGWGVPSNTSNAVDYNKWAEMHRFQVGDSILFVYQGNRDSVLQVNNDDFASCNTAAPIAHFNDGSTSFKFTKSGPYYFISGIRDNCLKNEKMVVIVMANRNSNSNQTASPPSPPPSGSTASPPSPPPSGSTVTVPAPAPTGEQAPSTQAPPPSAASSMLVSLISCAGAFVGSSFLLVL